ncbi:MAG: flippase-like domain-containing protein [bacterium]|nr:flippase-like domain-containing protein [bacterium]
MTWIGIASSLVCMYFALRGTDLRSVGKTLWRAHLLFVIAYAVAQVGFYWVKAVRWRWLLERRCTSGELFAPMMIGTLGNNVLPAHLGELVRMDFCARLVGFPRSSVLASLVLERMFDVLAVLALFAAGGLVLVDVPALFTTAAWWSAALALTGLGCAVLYVSRTEAVVRLVTGTTRMLPEGVRSRIIEQVRLGAAGMRALRDPRAALLIALGSLVQWACMAGSILFALMALDVDAPAAASVVILGAAVIGVTLPAAPGFFGTLELAFVIALQPFGIHEEAALAVALLYHVPSFVLTSLVGAYALRRVGARLSDAAPKGSDSFPA